jgi:hypothetical protein
MPKCPCKEPKIDGGETCRFCPLLVTFGSIEADTTTSSTVDIGDCGGDLAEQSPMMNGGW